MLMCLRDDHVDDVSLHTHVHRYVVFLVVLISVGLAQACPNYYESCHIPLHDVIHLSYTMSNVIRYKRSSRTCLYKYL